MPLRIKCPTGHVLIVPDNRVGRELRCPRCDQPFVVPAVDKKLSRQTGKVPTASPSSSSLDVGQPPPVVNPPAEQPLAARSAEAPQPADPKVKSVPAPARAKLEVAVKPPAGGGERTYPPRQPAVGHSAASAESKTNPKTKPAAARPKPEAAPTQSDPVVTPASATFEPPPVLPDKSDKGVAPLEPQIATSSASPPPLPTRSDPNDAPPEPPKPAPGPPSPLQPPPRLPDGEISLAPRKLPVKAPVMTDTAIAPPSAGEVAAQPTAPLPAARTAITAGATSGPTSPAPAAVAEPIMSPAERHGVIHGWDKRLTVYQLAAAFLAAALFAIIPAVWEIVDYIRNPDDIFIDRWAIIVLMLGVVQVGYAVYLIQVPDWTTVWVATIYSLVMAAVYAMACGLTLVASDSGTVVTALQLTFSVGGGRAALWSLCMTSVFTLLAFFAGRLSVRWHRTEMLLHSVGYVGQSAER